MAPDAQLAIRQIHLSQSLFDKAAADFDLFLKRYPAGKKAPDARFLKGMALRQSGQRDLAISEWQASIQKYPDSEVASYARTRIKRAAEES